MFNLSTQPFGPTKGEYYKRLKNVRSKIKTNEN